MLSKRFLLLPALRWAEPLILFLTFALPVFSHKAMVWLLVCCVLRLFFVQSWRLTFKTRYLLVLLPLCICLTSFLWTIDVGETVERSVKLMILLMGLVIILSQAGDAAYVSIRWREGAILSGIITGLGLTLLHIVSGGYPLATIKGLNGLPADVTNSALTVIAVGVVLNLWYWVVQGQKTIAFGLCALTLAILLVSEALAALIAFGVAMIIFAVGVRVSVKTGVRLMRLIGGAIFLCPALLIITGLDFSPLAYAQLPTSALHRVEIYNFVLQQIAERPLTGWGFGTSGVMPGGKDQLIQGWGETLPLHPHNGSLQIWLELGALGAMAFWLLWDRTMCWIGDLSLDQISFAAISAAIMAYVTVSLFANSLWASWWIAFGIILIFWIKASLSTNRPLVTDGNF